MNTQLESSIVRIFKSNGTVVGAGFLAGKKYVITCAHVVAQALGISEYDPEKPLADVYLDFPLAAKGKNLTAKVINWREVQKDQTAPPPEDIAVLEINEPLPVNVKPARIINKQNIEGHRFAAYGFPNNYDNGVWANGVLGRPVAPGWVQIEGDKETGLSLEPGFSGTPIWDEKLKGVVGIAVAADLERLEAKVAFMIPTQLLVKAWRKLGKWTISRISPFYPWTGISLTIILLLSGMTWLPPYWPGSRDQQIDLCSDSSQNKTTEKLKIVIANSVRNDGSKDHVLESKLCDELPKKIVGKDVIVYRNEQVVVKDSVAAKKLSERLGAIVVWSYKGSTSFIGGIEMAKLDRPDDEGFPSIPTKDWSCKFETEYFPNLTALLINLTISQIYYLDNNVEEARTTLNAALESASAQEFGNFSDDSFANAYFFLGLLFEPETPNCQNISQCKTALKKYEKALIYNPKLYEASLQQGILYQKMGNIDKAIDIFTKLINLGSKQTKIALINRSSLYMRKGNVTAAQADSQKLKNEYNLDLNKLLN